MFNRLISSFMLLLMLFYVACASTLQHSTLPASSPADASVLTSVDVALQGLPDAYQAPLNSQDASIPFTPGLGVNGEAIVPLNRGTQAPFNGVLFNGPAVARVTVEFRAQQQRCTIDREYDLSLYRARYNADIASLQLALNTQLQTDQALLNSRDVDIARLNRLLEVQQRQNSSPHVLEGLVWAGGGLFVGALLVGGIVIAVNARP